nr:hypothetical protein [Luteibacter rhizovicinus]
MSKGRIRIRVGDVVAIPLGEDDLIAFAVILPDANFAIFDARGNLSPEEALQHAPLFYVAVMDSAVKSGRWPVMKVEKEIVPEVSAPPTFMQDHDHPDKVRIYRDGAIFPSTLDEVVGLERTAVWSAEHVEDRIRDEYLGRKNKWVESLRLIT